MTKPTLRQRARYWFDNTLARGTSALVGWLAVVALTVVLLGGVVLWIVDREGARRRGFLGQLWQSVLHVLDPGTVTGDDTSERWFVIVGFVITIVGILIATTLIGVLTTGIDGLLTELRKGRSAVLEHDHTVLLGWSDQVFAIIPELVEANSNQRRASIAILADKDKVEMDDEIRSRVGDTGNTRVVTRSGSPIDPDDIALVNPQQAKSIIVLPSTSDHDRDAYLVKTLLAVSRTREGLTDLCPVVGAVTDPANLPPARLAGGENAHILDATDITSRLLVQTCLQSGLSVVYTNLLIYEGDELYFQEEPRLVGYTYGHALHGYQTSSVIGLRLANGEILINPPSDTPIRQGDQVIAISEDDDTVVLAKEPANVIQQAILAHPDPPPTRKRALLLGWNDRAPQVLLQLDQYVPPGSEAMVVSRHPQAETTLRQLAGRLHSLTLNFKSMDSSDRSALESLGVASYDHVLALCGDDVEPQLADSRTLVTLLHLRDMEQRSGGRFSIVSEMADDRNRTLASITQADDFVVSEKLISLLTTQISENPELATVFGILFESDGSEIYLKGAERYVQLGQTINFQTVLEAARWRGETAIGFRLGAQSHEPPNYGVVINPDKTTPLTLQPGDRIIVLAEN